MTATPCAPADMASAILSRLIPPIAKTGIRTSATTSLSVSSPIGGPYLSFEGVSYIGPSVMKSAPPLSAFRASSRLCVDTPIMSLLESFLTANGGMLFCVSCTPSASTAIAISTRSFMKSLASYFMVICLIS